MYPRIPGAAGEVATCFIHVSKDSWCSRRGGDLFYTCIQGFLMQQERWRLVSYMYPRIPGAIGEVTTCFIHVSKNSWCSRRGGDLFYTCIQGFLVQQERWRLVSYMYPRIPGAIGEVTTCFIHVSKNSWCSRRGGDLFHTCIQGFLMQ